MRSTAIVHAVLLGLAACASVASVSHAQAQPRSAGAASAPGGAERRAPPPEAIAACASLKAGQTCSFTSPRGAESGTCGQPEPTAPLACRPERRGPPAESIAACKERKSGDVCTFVSPSGRETGQCVQHERDRVLGCRPTRN